MRFVSVEKKVKIHVEATVGVTVEVAGEVAVTIT